MRQVIETKRAGRQAALGQGKIRGTGRVLVSNSGSVKDASLYICTLHIYIDLGWPHIGPPRSWHASWKTRRVQQVFHHRHKPSYYGRTGALEITQCLSILLGLAANVRDWTEISALGCSGS